MPQLSELFLEQVVGDRLADKIVQTAVQVLLFVHLKDVGGQGDHVGAGFFVGLAQSLGGLDAVHLGHLDVHQHQIVFLVFGGFEHLQAVCGHVGVVPKPAQQAEQHLEVDLVVFGDQNP